MKRGIQNARGQERDRERFYREWEEKKRRKAEKAKQDERNQSESKA